MSACPTYERSRVTLVNVALCTRGPIILGLSDCILVVFAV